MMEYIELFFSKSWEFFSIKWPGFEFSIGSVFLAAAVTVGALKAVMKMAGVEMPIEAGQAFASFLSGFAVRGGNNSLMVISNERRLDTK